MIEFLFLLLFGVPEVLAFWLMMLWWLGMKEFYPEYSGKKKVSDDYDSILRSGQEASEP